MSEDGTDVSADSTADTVQTVPVAEVIKQKKRAQAAEAELEAVRKSGRLLSAEQAEQFAQMLADAETAAEDKLRKAKDFDAIRAADKAKADAQVKAREDRIAALQARIEGQEIDQRILGALAKSGITDLTNALILVKAGLRVKFDHADETNPVTVLDSAGQPKLNEKGDPMTVAEFTDGWTKGDAGARYLPASGDSGSGVHNTGGPGSDSFAAVLADPDKQAAFIEKHGRAEFTQQFTAHRKAAILQREVAKP